MASPDYIREMADRIKIIEQAVTELESIGRKNQVPAVYKNARRIIASVNILKLEVSDILDLKI
jgi:hypothetical protein